MEYREFLQSKTAYAPSVGMTVDLSGINSILYPFQRKLVQWYSTGYGEWRGTYGTSGT